MLLGNESYFIFFTLNLKSYLVNLKENIYILEILQFLMEKNI